MVTVTQHLILPAFTLGLFYMAVYVRLTRASMLEVASEDFVRTARAKGVPEGTRPPPSHPAQRAPAGDHARWYPGRSAHRRVDPGGDRVRVARHRRLAFDAILARDYQVLLGVFPCTSILVMLFNLATDLLYVLVDPRVQTA